MNQYFLYIHRNTWLHRLDPRTKVLGLSALFVIALVFSDPRYLGTATVLTLALLASARALANLRKLGLLLILLFLYCVLLWPLFVSGPTPAFSIGSRAITREGLAFGIGMGLRLDLMLLDGLLLLSTTTIEEFTLALEHLGLPGSAGFALTLAFRWVPSLIGAAGQIVQAQRSRGLDLVAGSFLARVRRYPALLIPLIGHTLRQTRLLAMALEAKGIGPGARKHPFLELRLRPIDYLALGVVSLVMAISVWIRIRGYGSVEVQF
jgi:energy-coupling factor transport system permease protein